MSAGLDEPKKAAHEWVCEGGPALVMHVGGVWTLDQAPRLIPKEKSKVAIRIAYNSTGATQPLGCHDLPSSMASS